jgi:MFS family permease
MNQPSAADPVQRTARYLAIIQFLFFTTWVVYAVYLGDLLERVGIGRHLLIWFIILDQIIFALADTAMGYAADKVERMIGRLGPMIITLNGLSCLAFLLLPFSVQIDNSAIAQAVFTALIVIWIGTSSVLRAPPIVLLMKHAARPRAPRLAALSLLGLALGGAISPYLGLWLKTVDPAIPFVMTAATLFLVTLGLSRMETLIRAQPPQAASTANASVPFQPGNVVLLLLVSLLLGFGFQIHIFMNSKPQYLAFMSPADLPLLLPLFWIGFKLLVFPGAAAARRHGPLRIMSIAALIGGLALFASSQAPNLELLIGAQMLAGGAWGVLFMAGISASLGLGTHGREGLILGLWFSMLSLATVARAGLVAGGIQQTPELLALSRWMPAVLWAGAGLLLLYLAYRCGALRRLFTTS